MPRKLEDIETTKIALVDAAANKRKFYLIKRRNKAMEQLIKLLKNLLGEDTITDESIELLKSHSEETITEIEEALTVLEGYVGDLPGDAVNSLKTLTKFASIDFPVAKQNEDEEEEFDTWFEKAGKRFSKTTLADLKKIKEAIDNILTEKEDEVKKKTGGKENLSPETIAKLEKLEEMETKEAAELKKEAEEKEKAKETEIEDMKKKQDKLQEKIDELELKTKKRGVKKGLEENEEEEDTDEDFFPSMNLIGDTDE